MNRLHYLYKLKVTADSYLNQMIVTWAADAMIIHYVAGDGPAVIHSTPQKDSSNPVLTVQELPTRASNMHLCQSILHRA